MPSGAASSAEVDTILATARGCVADLLSAVAWEAEDRLSLQERAEVQAAALRQIISAEHLGPDATAVAAQLLDELEVAMGSL